MKKPLPNSHTRMRKVACTVSAAALMLGVSQAATIGINFQVNYCYDARYTGFAPLLTAFGVGTNNWESLTPMDTGYGTCPNNLTTITETVDTTTSAGGLHPLPNGSLQLTWSASTANFSGFGGYAVGNANGSYGGPPPPTSNPPRPFPSGEWAVYSAFLRDGTEFGPGSSCGYNTQPGYNVDIVGLKTVFTNTPYVIQLIAASDSMQLLTNAFIIDATLPIGVTQSVIYPNCPVPNDQGGTCGNFVRGHGGGLSTVTPAALNADHVKIIGNQAQNGSGSVIGNFDNASTISGFVITDKPVVTMSPQPVVAGVHDDVTLRAIAIGVPPLSYQWRNGGVPISGATSTSYSISNILSGGNYDLVVTNLYGSATSRVSVVTLDRLAIASATNHTDVIISWQLPGAILQSAGDVTGPYVDVAGPPTSPYTNTPPPATQFFRYRHDHNSIQSNPFDM